jgi:GAF domain-containing protein
MSAAVDMLAARRTRARVGNQLQLLCDLNRHLAGFADAEPLLRWATSHIRGLFGADGCAVLLVDRRREFYSAAASKSDASPASWVRLAPIRFPVSHGIAGWVYTHDRAQMVADVACDPRFYDGVDQRTGARTRSLLCAPLRTASGNIGVIEVVNPTPGVPADDLSFLEALAGDLAVAYDRTRRQQRGRDLLPAARDTCSVAGVGLFMVGVVAALTSLLGHLAWALPLRELLVRPGMLTALGVAVSGGLLAGAGRGRRAI